MRRIRNELSGTAILVLTVLHRQ